MLARLDYSLHYNLEAFIPSVRYLNILMRVFSSAIKIHPILKYFSRKFLLFSCLLTCWPATLQFLRFCFYCKLTRLIVRRDSRIVMSTLTRCRSFIKKQWLTHFFLLLRDQRNWKLSVAGQICVLSLVCLLNSVQWESVSAVPSVSLLSLLVSVSTVNMTWSTSFSSLLSASWPRSPVSPVCQGIQCSGRSRAALCTQVWVQMPFLIVRWLKYFPVCIMIIAIIVSIMIIAIIVRCWIWDLSQWAGSDSQTCRCKDF